MSRIGLTRRDFLRKGGGIAAALAAGPTVLAACQPRSNSIGGGSSRAGQLRILQWSHFVPQHDKWFDPFAVRWGEQNGVSVTVDHVSLADLPSRADAEINAGEGHDLIELLSPPSALEPSLVDLTDINEEAQSLYGPPVALCRRSTYNPNTEKYYGFCHGWVPDPGNYRRSLWEQIGMVDGPFSWETLLIGGALIKEQLGIHMGIGMSRDIDSNMAARALIWSHGGSIQDENENVAINSPEVVEAVTLMKELYERTMTPDVFGWKAASNNQGLIAGELSYIVNSISAYRTAQKVTAEVADDVFFTPPLQGPRGDRLASQHVIPTYVIPKHSKNPEAAKQLLLDLVGAYDQATFNSELYVFPAFPSMTPHLFESEGWLEVDPFGSRPVDKLAFLKDAETWSTTIGHPGPANAATADIFGQSIIPDMMAKAARGDRTPEQAVEEAETQIRAIFGRWRREGLVGGTS